MQIKTGPWSLKSSTEPAFPKHWQDIGFCSYHPQKILKKPLIRYSRCQQVNVRTQADDISWNPKACDWRSIIYSIVLEISSNDQVIQELSWLMYSKGTRGKKEEEKLSALCWWESQRNSTFSPVHTQWLGEIIYEPHVICGPRLAHVSFALQSNLHWLRGNLDNKSWDVLVP